MDGSSENTKDILRQFWQQDRYLQIANPITRNRAGAGSLWSDPDDIKPRKELIRLNVGIPDMDELPRA
ncbi:MAG: hypothetical protein JXA41_12235 [Deltaproteobacteria bacterium]|nr:hypothetical protein [Deltaproteobacteria bacterium]